MCIIILYIYKTPFDFRWPDIDEDIELEALESPEKYILRYEK